jgi:hypothetical protein
MFGRCLLRAFLTALHAAPPAALLLRKISSYFLTNALDIGKKYVSKLTPVTPAFLSHPELSTAAAVLCDL